MSECVGCVRVCACVLERRGYHHGDSQTQSSEGTVRVCSHFFGLITPVTAEGSQIVGKEESGSCQVMSPLGEIHMNRKVRVGKREVVSNLHTRLLK